MTTARIIVVLFLVGVGKKCGNVTSDVKIDTSYGLK